MKILCGIIIYNPDLDELYSAINSVLDQVDEILIVNNSCSESILELLIKHSKKIKMLNYAENKGVAFALNSIIEYSIKNKFDFTLTMDQDSCCSKDYIFKMLEKDEENVALFTPYIVDLNEEDDKNLNDIRCDCYIDYCITSGCLMKNAYIEKIGYFTNELFIDFVDFDYCLKVFEKGFKIKKIGQANLYHHLGNAKEIKLLSILSRNPVYTYNHNSLRTFYYNRNAIYLIKRYRYMPSKLRFVLGVIKWNILKLMFEKNKIEKFNSMIKGIVEGFKMEVR